jgi:hypothetical protein
LISDTVMETLSSRPSLASEQFRNGPGAPLRIRERIVTSSCRRFAGIKRMMGADHFRRPIAKDALGACIPARNDAAQVLSDDRLPEEATIPATDAMPFPTSGAP